MKFCIATVQFWQSHGFDITDWRKSVDGTKAIVHMEYARVLVLNIESNSNVTIYTAPSEELNAVLNGAEWTIPIEV